MLPGTGLELTPGLLVISVKRLRGTFCFSSQTKALALKSWKMEQLAGGDTSQLALPVTPVMAAWPVDAASARIVIERVVRVFTDVPFRVVGVVSDGGDVRW